MESNNLKEEKNQIKSKDKYDNLKNDYFLQKVFNNLEKKKSLDFIKYNKSIKKRLNINIKDYKEYSEKYSSIEIEIKPVNNKYGKFINIKKEDEHFFHIYFNNNKEEIKRYHIDEGEKIKIIKIIINYQIESFGGLFYNCKCVESINFKKIYRNNINNMAGMFFGCTSLKELIFNNFITDNVNNMSCMFFECSSLNELNLINFNTNNVNNMSCMFFECSSLKKLNLNNFNTNNVTDMSRMFFGCSSLNELNINNFNTNNVTDMRRMFVRCPNELVMKIKTQFKNIKKEAF